MKINNENMVLQLQLHNESAMEFLIKEHGICLISIIRKHLFTLPHLQMECLIETLVNIWNHIDSFREENEFENWIGTTARYCCLEFLKKHQEEATIAWLIEKEIAEEKEVMISSLDEEYQELFYRFYVGEIIKAGSKEYTYHNMYELLNEIDTDICEYEKEPLKPLEQEMVLGKLRSRIGKKKHGLSLNRYLDILFQRTEHKQVVL